MNNDDETGRAGNKDPVEEAADGSFPASDPPAWTATRSGKPESPAAKDARKLGEQSPPEHCEAVGLFASETAARAGADALLAAGFNMVDLGPPRRHGSLEAGIGGAADKDGSLGLCAALGALAGGALAALFAPRGTRYLIAAAAGGAAGAVSARAAASLAQKRGTGWPQNGWLLRVKLKSPKDQENALAIIEGQGAQKMHVSWPHARC
jgi:hypothetical protein